MVTMEVINGPGTSAQAQNLRRRQPMHKHLVGSQAQPSAMPIYSPACASAREKSMLYAIGLCNSQIPTQTSEEPVQSESLTSYIAQGPHQTAPRATYAILHW